jgi:hypothetical protein
MVFQSVEPSKSSYLSNNREMPEEELEVITTLHFEEQALSSSRIGAGLLGGG